MATYEVFREVPCSEDIITSSLKKLTFSYSIDDLSTRITVDLEALTTAIEAGQDITLDNIDGFIGDIGHSMGGADGDFGTTLNFRSELSKLLLSSPDRNLSFITAPTYTWEQLKRGKDVDTALFIRNGDDIGRGGWTMRMILTEIAYLLGLAIRGQGYNLIYSLPDFWVQQYQVSMTTPYFQALASGISSFKPNINIVGNYVVVSSPLENQVLSSGSLVLDATKIDVLNQREVYTRPPKTLIFTGGQGPFDINRYRGRKVHHSGRAEDFYIFGQSWGRGCPGFFETRVTSVKDSNSLTVIKQVYAMSKLGDERGLVYQQTVKYKRRIGAQFFPAIGDPPPFGQDWNYQSSDIVNYDMTDSDTGSSPLPDGLDIEDLIVENYQSLEMTVDPTEYRLMGMDLVLNFFYNLGDDYDRPLLWKTLMSKVQYLYYPLPKVERTPYGVTPAPNYIDILNSSKEAIEQAIREVYLRKEGETIVNYTPDPNLPIPNGYERAIYCGKTEAPAIGIWAEEGWMEQTLYHYEHEQHGGRLKEQINRAWGDVYLESAYWDEEGVPHKNDVQIYQKRADIDRFSAFPYRIPPEYPMRNLRTSVTRYKEVGYRHAQKATFESELNSDWVDVEQEKIIELADSETRYPHSHYKVKTSFQQIPLSQVPTSWSRMRQMPIKLFLSIDEEDAFGKAEISVPLVCDWFDAQVIAEWFKNYLIQSSNRKQTTIVMKGKHNVPVGAAVSGQVRDGMNNFDSLECGENPYAESVVQVEDGNGDVSTEVTIIGYRR